VLASVLYGQSCGCLILEGTDQLDYFWRKDYVRFEPRPDSCSVAYRSTDKLANFFCTEYARDLLCKPVGDGKIPDSACSKPDHAGLYTITLV
jgi:hypothetical protein